jgi:hypothetical protein
MGQSRNTGSCSRCLEGLELLKMVTSNQDVIDKKIFPDRRRFSYTVHIPERRREQPPSIRTDELDSKNRGNQEYKKKKIVCRLPYCKQGTLFRTSAHLSPRMALTPQKIRRRQSMKRCKRPYLHKIQNNLIKNR